MDAVLLVGFGGPEQPGQIRPFLQHVLQGRRVSPERIEEVAHHYEVIGGRSPFNALTELQRAALERELAARGLVVPVRAGMWHAPPFCEDVLRGLAEAGARDVVVVVMAAFYDTATLARYRGVVDAALKALNVPGLRVTYSESPEDHPGFISAASERVRAAFRQIPAELHATTKLLFTAHSVPTAVGESSGYVERYHGAAARIAESVGFTGYRCVYQSRSGAPGDAWLEPDVCLALREETWGGTQRVVIAPIGFVCDHVEVLYDLDVEAKQVSETVGPVMVRAGTVGDHPDYIAALVERVLDAR